ncbi:MAG: hypothetical protein HYU71_03970 [Bacteroidetes bacterium]|nr:hypothetical protein [Bacteroidota bacterium]
MKKIIIAIVLLNFYSCATNRVLITVECKLNDAKGSRVTINIPKYKNQQVIKADAEEGVEYVFWYKDSSAIYVSTFKGGANLNYENIRNTPDAYNKRFSSTNVNLQGVDVAGKAWREIKREDLYVGYFRINMKDKQVFDQAIDDYILK